MADFKQATGKVVSAIVEAQAHLYQGATLSLFAGGTTELQKTRLREN